MSRTDNNYQPLQSENTNIWLGAEDYFAQVEVAREARKFSKRFCKENEN